MSRIGPSLTNKPLTDHSRLKRTKREDKHEHPLRDQPTPSPTTEESTTDQVAKQRHEIISKLTLFSRLQADIRPNQHYWLSSQKHMAAEHREALILWLISLSTCDASVSQMFPVMETVLLFDRVLCHPSFRHMQSTQLQPLLIACFMTVISKLSGAIAPLKKLLNPQVRTTGSRETVDLIEHFSRRIEEEVKGTSRSYLICSHSTVLQLLGLYFKLRDEEIFFARMLLEAAVLDFSSLRYSPICLTLTVVSLVLQLTRAVSWKAVLPSFESFVSPDEFVRCAKNLLNPMLRRPIAAQIRMKFQMREWLMVGYWTVDCCDKEDIDGADERQRAKSSTRP